MSNNDNLNNEKNSKTTSFYEREELLQFGFQRLGDNVLLSRRASIYNPEDISLGNNVRIDDFCILSGKIRIGDYVHIAVFSALFASTAGITVNDFCNISSRVCIYAISDDFSGNSMSNPMVPEHLKNITRQPVTLEKHSIVGSGSTVLPGAYIAEGTAIGAMSLVKDRTQPWCIYAGVPAKKLKDRECVPLRLEEELKG